MYSTIKDEIIDFVRNSEEEDNSKVAIFIAGMNAQKKVMECQRETAVSKDDFTMVNNSLGKK